MDKNIKKETVYLYIVLFANFLLPLVTIPYLTRVLGLSGFGLVGYCQTIFLLFNFIIEFGFTLTGARSISININIKDETNKIYTNIQIVRFLIYLLIFITTIFSLLLFNINSLEREIIFLSLVCSFSTLLIPSFLFNGLSKNSIMAFVTVILKVIFIFPIFFLIKNNEDILLACFLQLFPSLLIGLIIQYIIWKKDFAKFNIKLFDYNICKSETKRAFNSFIASFFTLTFTYFTPLLVKYMLGNSALGLYIIIDKLINVLRQLYNPLVQAFFSKISILYTEKNRILYINLLKKVSLIFMLIGLSFFIGNLLLGDMILPLLLGKDYNLTYLLSIAIFTQIIISVALILVNFVIIPSDKNHILKNIYFLAMIFYFPLNYMLTSYLGLSGVLYSMLVLEILITSYLLFYCIKSKLFAEVP